MTAGSAVLSRSWLLLALAGPLHATGEAPPIEDAAARARLPEFQVIPAATPAELTPASPQAAPADSYTTWSVSHGDAGSRRYSALRQITRENVARLRVAWEYRSGDGPGNIQANPIIVDGVLYGPTPGRAIVALDATNGRELWRFQVEAPAVLRLEDAPARRGLVYWPGDARSAPRVVFASGNWLYALDPKTGRPLADFGEAGRTPLPTGGTAVGVIWRDTYIVPGLWGDIYAFDLRDGRQLWRFHTIPRDGEFGADTWVGRERQGAHCWGGLSLDAERGLVFAALGAARPDFIGVERHGDNLFSNCLVALDAATGERRWHFQNIRHDLWDLDNTAPPNLATITRDGRKVDVVAAVTKPGVTLLLDRTSGKPVFPFRLRRAPTSNVPGEVTAAYQPDPELPEPLSDVEARLEDLTRRTPEAHEWVRRQVERGTVGRFEPPNLARPVFFRSTRGGAEWTGAAIDVPTGRLYVSTNHLLSVTTVFPADDLSAGPREPSTPGEKYYQLACSGCHGPNREGLGMVPTLIGLRHRLNEAEVLELLRTGRSPMPPAPPMTDEEKRSLLDFLLPKNPPAPAAGQPTYAAVGYKFITDHEGYPGVQPPWGQLQCLDLNTGRILWRVPLGEYPELTAQGVPLTGTENFGGPTVTAGGLVFCAGTRDERLRAFDADTGAELWSAQLPFGGYAPPSVYEVNGKQYVVITATGGGKVGTKTGDAWIAFALPD